MLRDTNDELNSPECERFTFRGSGLPDENSVGAIELMLKDALTQDNFVALHNGAERAVMSLEQLRRREAANERA